MSKKYFYKLVILVFTVLFTFNAAFAGTKGAGAACSINPPGDCISGYVCKPTVAQPENNGICTAISSSNNTSINTGLPNFSDIGGLLTNFNKNIVQNLITLLSGAALVVFLWGLVRFIYDRARGDEKDLQKDKEGMLWGLGALFVLVSVWGIIKMVQDIFGISGDNSVYLPKICINGNCTNSSSSGSSNGLNGSGGSFDKTALDKLGEVGGTVDGSYTNDEVLSWSTPIKSGDNNTQVAQLQTILNKYSSANLTVDGKFGSATYSAVKAFQSANKLIPDGIVGPSTKAVILYRYMKVTPISNASFLSWPDLSLGSQGTSVTELQQFLKNSGCYNADANSTPDGKFGSDTKDAVDNYQKVNSLLEDSIVGPSTKSVIVSMDTSLCR